MFSSDLPDGFLRGLSNTQWPTSTLLFRLLSIQPMKCSGCVVKEGITGGSQVSQLATTGPLPSLNHLAQIIEDGSLSANRNVNVIQSSSCLHGCRIEDVPDEWIGLSSTQYILISASDLNTICKQHDFKRRGIENWVAAGGSLIVFDCGSKYEKLKQIFPRLLGIESAQDLPDFQSPWRIPDDRLKDLDFSEVNDRSSEQDSYSYPLPKKRAYPKTVRSASLFASPFENWKIWNSEMASARNAPPYLMNRYANGRIAAVGGNMQDWKVNDWSELYNGLVAGRLDLKAMDDLIGTQNNDSLIAEFSVPGVGQTTGRCISISDLSFYRDRWTGRVFSAAQNETIANVLLFGSFVIGHILLGSDWLCYFR